MMDPYSFVLSDNKIVLSSSTASNLRLDDLERLPTGEYVFVVGDINLVDNSGQHGLTKLKASKVVVEEETTNGTHIDSNHITEQNEGSNSFILRIWHRLQGKSTLKNIDNTDNSQTIKSKKRLSTDEMEINMLTQEQCSAIIKDINSSRVDWAWTHATRDVKVALKTTLSPEDEAREIVRTAINRYSSDKNYEDAKLHICSAIKKASKINADRCELGKMALQNGQVTEAISFFEEEISTSSNPKLLTAHSYLAAIYDAQGKRDKANHHAEKAIVTDEYRKMPSHLHPDVVKGIHEAVQKQNG